MDEDEDGFITVEDMNQNFFRKYLDPENFDEKEIGPKMFLLMDDDGDGKISFTGTFS